MHASALVIVASMSDVLSKNFYNPELTFWLSGAGHWAPACRATVYHLRLVCRRPDPVIAAVLAGVRALFSVATRKDRISLESPMISAKRACASRLLRCCSFASGGSATAMPQNANQVFQLSRRRRSSGMNASRRGRCRCGLPPPAPGDRRLEWRSPPAGGDPRSRTLAHHKIITSAHLIDHVLGQHEPDAFRIYKRFAEGLALPCTVACQFLHANSGPEPARMAETASEIPSRLLLRARCDIGDALYADPVCVAAYCASAGVTVSFATMPCFSCGMQK